MALLDAAVRLGDRLAAGSRLFAVGVEALELPQMRRRAALGGGQKVCAAGIGHLGGREIRARRVERGQKPADIRAAGQLPHGGGSSPRPAPVAWLTRAMIS